MRLKLSLMSIIKKWLKGDKSPDNDRRSFFRLKAHHLVKYKVVGKTQELSFARDVSAGGLRFFAKETIPPGTIIEMELNFPEYQEPIKTLVKVVRVRHLKKAGGVEIGAQFVEIEEKARAFMKDKIVWVSKDLKSNGKDR